MSWAWSRSDRTDPTNGADQLSGNRAPSRERVLQLAALAEVEGTGHADGAVGVAQQRRERRGELGAGAGALGRAVDHREDAGGGHAVRQDVAGRSEQAVEPLHPGQPDDHHEVGRKGGDPSHRVPLLDVDRARGPLTFEVGVDVGHHDAERPPQTVETGRERVRPHGRPVPMSA